MFELFDLFAVILALAALVGGRRTAERLERELATLRAEVASLKASSRDGVEAEGTSEEFAAAPELPTETETVAAVGLPASVHEGERILGDAEKAAEGIEGDGTIAAGTEAPQPVMAAPRKAESLESRLGARWAVWVGGIALALGGVFMVKYSIDAGLLSPAVRLTLAALFGLLLVAAGRSFAGAPCLSSPMSSRTR